MPISSVIDPERGVVVTTAHGVLTGSDARQAKKDLLEDPRFRSGLRELADFRAVTKMDLLSEDIERLIAMDESYADVLESYDVAFLVASDVAFGMARMYRMRSKREGHVSVFRDEEAALAWLDRPRDPEPAD